MPGHVKCQILQMFWFEVLDKLLIRMVLKYLGGRHFKMAQQMLTKIVGSTLLQKSFYAWVFP